MFFPCVGCVQLASLVESLMKVVGHRCKSNFKAAFLLPSVVRVH